MPIKYNDIRQILIVNDIMENKDERCNYRKNEEI